MYIMLHKKGITVQNNFHTPFCTCMLISVGKDTSYIHGRNEKPNFSDHVRPEVRFLKQ